MDDAPAPFPDAVEDWAALRTSARWEKKLADDLGRVGVPVYLPTVTRLATARGGKQTTSLLPLFPGYVFCSAGGFVGNPAVPANLRSKVAQVLRPADPAPLLRELRAVADLLTDRRLVQERVVGKPGETVRVVGGPLTGSVGTVVKLKPHKYAVVVEVSLIGARLLAEIDEALLAKESGAG
jgi:transcription antitermination factor NusG